MYFYLIGNRFFSIDFCSKNKAKIVQHTLEVIHIVGNHFQLNGIVIYKGLVLQDGPLVGKTLNYMLQIV